MFLISVLALCPFLALAQEDPKKELLPPGMEKIKVGRSSEVLVPAGTKTHKVGDLVVLETPGEYVARRIVELEERLSKIESLEKELSLKIEKLEAQLEQLQKKSTQPVEKENK